MDHGTSFSVVADATTGSTRTQVYEGQAKVRKRASGKLISLTQGQTNTTAAGLMESEPTIIGPPDRSPDWIEVETTRDAYVGTGRDPPIRNPPAA